MTYNKNIATREDSIADSYFLNSKLQQARTQGSPNIYQTSPDSEGSEMSDFVYTTEMIDALIARIQEGDQDVDKTPFYQGDPSLRGPNVVFSMTPEEDDEWTNCFLEPIHFIETYCNFKTDYGWGTVDLYDFQKDIIDTTTATHYDEETDLFIPDNRNVILMCSRQTGKCVNDSKIDIKDNSGLRSLSIQQLFDERRSTLRKKISVYTKIRQFLYKLYRKNICKLLVGFLIQFVESLENKGRSIVDDKFIDVMMTPDISVRTESGYQDTLAIWKTKPFNVYKVTFTDGTTLEGADNHIVFGYDLDQIFLKDLLPGESVISTAGNKIVKSVKRYPFKHCMYDLVVNSKNHSYFTDGVLSHNTTTTVCILTYYLCFMCDKNIAVMANKLGTAKEIVDKLINVFKGLPYFLKPGCINFGATYIKLDNGCRVIANSTTKSTSIGFTIDVLYLDEFAHVPPNVGYDFWRSVIPTLSSLKTSQCIISSTPNGVNNKFYDVWDGAVKKENSYKPIKVEWWRVPGRDDVWAEQTKKDFGEEEFAQEFDLQFHVNSANLLKSSELQFNQRISTEYHNIDFQGLDKSLSDKIYWHPKFDPTMISPSDYFVLSVDTAEGRDVETQSKKDSDYNVVSIFKVIPLSKAKLRSKRLRPLNYADCFRLKQVGVYMDRDVNEEGAARVARFITFDLFKCGSGSYDNVRLLIEMNFNGRNFINIFNQHRNYYPAVIFSTYHTKQIPGERQRTKLGYKTTPANREYFLKNGAALLGSHHIVVDHKDKYNINLSTIGQLENFSKVNNKYQGVSCHDDISMTVLNLSRLWSIDAYNSFLEDYIDYHLDPEIKTRIERAISAGNAYYDDSDDALSSMIDALGDSSGYSDPFDPDNFMTPGNGLPYGF